MRFLVLEVTMRKVYLLIVCAALQLVLAFGETSKETTRMSVVEFADQYLRWFASHPDAGGDGGTTIRLDLPMLDFYSPSGRSIYFGADSAKNGAFLDSLPQRTPEARRDGVVRPSLKEAIEMFPEFRAQEATLLADKRFTVLAITFPDWDEAKEQNDAVARLRRRVRGSDIRILVVNLHR
jgi:hypothetical protein